MSHCPKCENKGHQVGIETLEAQLDSSRFEALDHSADWRYCTSKSCAVAYYSGQQLVEVEALHATPYRKSDSPHRLVCFCFQHTVAAVETDLDEDGNSSIRSAIQDACKAGEDDCPRKNPQGRCCLGNVGEVIRNATNSADASTENSGTCC